MPKISERTGKPICSCGKGYASAFDGKCANHGCRNKREREAFKRHILLNQ